MSLLEFLRRDPACTSLAEGAFHAVAPLLEDPDPTLFLRELEGWTLTLAGRMPLPWNLHAALDVIQAFLFQEQDLQGDRDTYDAPENAVLPLVLQRRRGLPITLAILWIDTCRRLGLDAVGVGLPGHFLAALRTDVGLLYVDAFHQGRAVDEAGAQALMAHATGDARGFRPDHLAPLSDRAVLVRLVRNLHVRYVRMADWPNALWTATHLVLLEPNTPRAYKDRALIHFHRGNLEAAAADLRQALQHAPAGDETLETWLKRLS